MDLVSPRAAHRQMYMEPWFDQKGTCLGGFAGACVVFRCTTLLLSSRLQPSSPNLAFHHPGDNGLDRNECHHLADSLMLEA